MKYSVSEVSSNPKEDPQTHRISRQVSNWLDQWSNEFLQEEEDRDPAILKVKNLLLETTVCPKLNEPSPSSIVNTLLRP